MAEENGFKTWAVVEVMGHQSYAGFVTTETIAGAPMLRVDVPKTSTLDGFTKYLSASSLYALSPCTEETAKSRAEVQKKTPFDCYSVERQMMEDLRAKGKLVEHPQLAGPALKEVDFDDDDDEFDDHEDDGPDF